MARANTATLDGLVVGYGTRDTINPQDAVVHTLGRIKQAEVYIDVSNYTDFAEGTLAPSTHFVIPAGSAIHSVKVMTEDAWNNLTSVAMGLKDTVDGSQVNGADDTVLTDALGVLADLGAGDVITGVGSLGQTGDPVTAADATLSFTVTGTAPTTGRSRVLVEYVEPVVSQDAPSVITGEI